MKKILIILAHPSKNSLNSELAKSYLKGAKDSKAEVRQINLIDLKFDVNRLPGENDELEPDLQKAQDDIKWSDHIVIFYPTWWGTIPALLKGFIDRVFMPGFAFEYVPNSAFPKKLLTDRSLRCIVTMDTPTWWFYTVYRASQYKTLKQLVFNFVGFKPVKFTTYGSIRTRNEKSIKEILNKTYLLGKNQK